MTHTSYTPFRDLVDSFQQGDIDRRQFLARASALGIGSTVAVFLANASPVLASGGSKTDMPSMRRTRRLKQAPQGFPRREWRAGRGEKVASFA